MTPLRVLLALVVLAIPGVAVGALAWADQSASERLPSGARVAGVPVGDLDKEAALARLQARVGHQARRPVRVRVAGNRYTLSARRAGVRLDLRAAVDRVHEAGRGGNLFSRGWRYLSGEGVDLDEPAPVKLEKGAVRRFVATIHRDVAREPVDAHLQISATSVTVGGSRPGRRLAGRDDLVRRVTAALKNPDADRSLRASVAKVRPTRTKDEVWDATPVVVTVDRSGRTARVFRRGKMVKSYGVAVGEPKYPTPVGRFEVQTKQVNPPWNVPNSEWAGSLAGQTVPGGDPRNPLKARWIGFNGSVGFHGTDSIGSLGTAASHGCVRMARGDVIDLYERVEVGTPVVVAA